MKLDYDLIKALLEKIETTCHGRGSLYSATDGLDNFEMEQIDYHINILADDDLVEIAEVVHAGFICVSRLTAEGHRVLEAMRSNSVWNKIKDQVISAGISGLKQIPALAIKYIIVRTDLIQ